MAKTPYLIKQGKTWWFSRAVPRPLQEQIGKKLWRIRLGHDLAVEISKDEIVGTLVHAESAEQARAFGRDLFPGCNVMAVLRDGEPGAEID